MSAFIQTNALSHDNLPYFKSEKAKVLLQARESYTSAIRHYNENHLELAEQEFVKALKPFLSKPSMRSVYVEVGDFKEQLLDSMYKLGNIYLTNVQSLDHHSKAAAIFQYCAAFAKKYEIQEYRVDGVEIDFLHEAYSVEQRFLSAIGRSDGNEFEAARSVEEQVSRYDKHKKSLEQVRSVVAEKLELIAEWPIDLISERAKVVEETYKESTNFFVNNNPDRDINPGLIQQLLKHCVEQLGQPPEGSEHAVIALGSLAGGKMTPWSDLEFAILINEDRHEFKEYFRNLTKLLHIKVINLGETPLRSVGIESFNNFRTANDADDWFWDELTNNGFSFDGPDWYASKLPFGRQGGYKAKEKVKNANTDVEEEIIISKPDFELILTPEQIAQFQLEEEKKGDRAKKESWFDTDRHLVQALRSVALIDGSQGLLDDYRAIVREQYEQNKELIQSRSLQVLAENIDDFELKLGDEEEGKLLDVKKSIYRVADRVIDALANYYGIVANDVGPQLTSWKIIDRMKSQNILSEEGAAHLKEALSIATELRLATYSHNKGQKESVSTYVPAVKHLTEERQKELIEETFHIKDTSCLHHFYYVMTRVQTFARTLCSNDEEHNQLGKMVLQSDPLFDNTYYTKGLVHARFLQYDMAIQYMERAGTSSSHNLEVLNQLQLLYSKTGAVDKALNLAHELLSLIEIDSTLANHSKIATCYNNLGAAYRSKGDYDRAIEYHTNALKMSLEYYKIEPNHPGIAANYNGLGLAYSDKGDYDKAIECYVQGLEIQKKAYTANPNHPNIASSYNNLGLAYRSKGEYSKAIEYHTQSLEIRKKAYSTSPNHHCIARSYHNLGSAYVSAEEYDNAIECYAQGFEIRKKIYSTSPNHPETASSYNNLGNVFRLKGEYDRAIEYHTQSLEITKKAYSTSPNHHEIATCYNNLGLVYGDKGNYEKATECYTKALEIQKNAHVTNPNHPNNAMCYCNLGGVFYDQSKFDKAIECYSQALKMFLEVYATSPDHPHIIMCYNNLGTVYKSIAQDDDAIKCFKKAYEINLARYHQDPSHPSVLNSLQALEEAYHTRDLRPRVAENLYAAKAITSSLDHKVEYVFKGSKEYYQHKKGKDPNLVDIRTDMSTIFNLTKNVAFVIPEGYGFSGLRISGKEIQTSCEYKPIQKITVSFDGVKHYVNVERQDDIVQKGIIYKTPGPKTFGGDVPMDKIVLFYNLKNTHTKIEFGTVMGLETMQYVNELQHKPPVPWPDHFETSFAMRLEGGSVVELVGDTT